MAASFAKLKRWYLARGWSHLQVGDRLILISQPEHYEQFLEVLTEIAGMFLGRLEFLTVFVGLMRISRDILTALE